MSKITVNVDEVRLKDGIQKAMRDNPYGVVEIVRNALILETVLYNYGSTIDAVFNLRKALEGIWGHDLPVEIDDE